MAGPDRLLLHSNVYGRGEVQWREDENRWDLPFRYLRPDAPGLFIFTGLAVSRAQDGSAHLAQSTKTTAPPTNTTYRATRQRNPTHRTSLCPTAMRENRSTDDLSFAPRQPAAILPTMMNDLRRPYDTPEARSRFPVLHWRQRAPLPSITDRPSNLNLDVDAL